MKQRLLILLCLIGPLSFAQQKREARDVNTENFPEVSFIWNQYNPEIFDADNFSLSEDGKEIRFSCYPVNNPDIPERNKTILFLWEDMPGNSKQYDFAQSLLYYFLKDNLANQYPDDIYNVAVFNRKRIERPFLNTLLPDFTKDKMELSEAIALYPHASNSFEQPDRSDLYTALDAGLDLLSKSPANNIKVIVIVTHGLNVEMPGAKTDYSDIVRSAKKYEIPVYVIKNHPVPRDVIEQIAKKTYGETIHSTDATEARTMLWSVYQGINQHHYGRDYEFVFESSHKQDGQQYTLLLKSSDSIVPVSINYTTPEMPFIEKVLDKLLLISLVVVLLGGFTFLAVRYFRKKKLEDEKRDKVLEEKYQEKIQDVEHAKSQILQESEDRQKAWQAHQQQIEEEQKRAKEKEWETQVASLMYAKNLFPRLQCVVGNNAFMFHVQKPVTTIGRNDTNDLVLANDTVSGSHAKLVFTGSEFEIHDLRSTNKVIVNGFFTEQTSLRNGDIIGLGEALLTFYI